MSEILLLVSTRIKKPSNKISEIVATDTEYKIIFIVEVLNLKPSMSFKIPPPSSPMIGRRLNPPTTSITSAEFKSREFLNTK